MSSTASAPAISSSRMSRGNSARSSFLNPEIGLFNTKDPIKLHVSAYGPRSQALTAKLGAAWKCFIQDVPGGIAALEHAEKLGRSGAPEDDLYATAWACGCILRPGESLSRASASIAQSGPRAAVLLHRHADMDQQGWQNTTVVEAPEGIAAEVNAYVEMARRPTSPKTPATYNNHRGHFVFVKPEERLT